MRGEHELPRKCAHGVFVPSDCQIEDNPCCSICKSPIALTPDELQHYQILKKNWK
jgi:hypothetical protein